MTDSKQQILATPAGDKWLNIGIKHHHGINVPLFSLHSNTSCGIGEYPDLLGFIPWCQEIGLDIIQLLPLNDPGVDSSPYCSISAYALSPLHLGLSQLPHVDESPTLLQIISKMQQLNRKQRVDYPAVLRGKEAFLTSYYEQYGTTLTSTPPYIEFKKQNEAWLSDFALFKTLKIRHGWQCWESWPAEIQNPSSEDIEFLKKEHAAEMEYHMCIQYLCFDQFCQVKQRANDSGIFIKGDIPILINRESADVWRHQEFFDLNHAAGAPPDMYIEEGQKWGFPIYNWEMIAEQNYAWWIERLRVASSLYHLYRLDHIVGFFRIWAIPLDAKPKEGSFIPADESVWIPHGQKIMEVMLKNCSMLPIGEDLGTIPPEVRTCMKQLGICGTKVMRWERRWDTDGGFINPKDYIPESMTTVSTHDSETLELWWRDRPEESEVYAEAFGWQYAPQLSADQRLAILKSSHHSGSLFHINLLQEYLALIPHLIWTEPEDERINVPGVISDLNWTYRFRPSVEEIVDNPTLKDLFQQILQDPSM